MDVKRLEAVYRKIVEARDELQSIYNDIPRPDGYCHPVINSVLITESLIRELDKIKKQENITDA